MHRLGLNQLISVKGGIHKFDHNKFLRLQILLYVFLKFLRNTLLRISSDEVCGACAFDIMPKYSLPDKLLAPMLPQSIQTVFDDSAELASHKSLIKVLQDLQILAEFIQESGSEIWSDRDLLPMKVSPIMHRLFTLPEPVMFNQNSDNI